MIATSAAKGSIKCVSGEYGDCVAFQDQDEHEDEVLKVHFVKCTQWNAAKMVAFLYKQLGCGAKKRFGVVINLEHRIVIWYATNQHDAICMLFEPINLITALKADTYLTSEKFHQYIINVSLSIW